MPWLSTLFLSRDFSEPSALAALQKSADPAAFAFLVRRWEAPIRRLCIRMVGPDRAENLAQETFVRLFARRLQFDPARTFSTWLWQIAVNVCREDWRKNQRHPEAPLDDRDPRAPYPSPAEHAEAREQSALVQQALAALPDRLREVVILREYHGLTFREIADILDTPQGTLKYRMAEGLALLAKRLAPQLGKPLPTRHQTVPPTPESSS